MGDLPQTKNKKVKTDNIDDLINELEEDNAQNDLNEGKKEQDLEKSQSIKNQMKMWRKVIFL